METPLYYENMSAFSFTILVDTSVSGQDFGASKLAIPLKNFHFIHVCKIKEIARFRHFFDCLATEMIFIFSQ